MASALGSIVMTSRSICAKIPPYLFHFHHLPSPPGCAGIWTLKPGPHIWACSLFTPVSSRDPFLLNRLALVAVVSTISWALGGFHSHNTGDQLVMTAWNAMLRNGLCGKVCHDGLVMPAMATGLEQGTQGPCTRRPCPTLLSSCY